MRLISHSSSRTPAGRHPVADRTEGCAVLDFEADRHSTVGLKRIRLVMNTERRNRGGISR